MNLEKYLNECYPSDIQDVSEVEAILASAIMVFENEADFEKSAWPYAIPSASASPMLLSQSTTAMIVNTLLRYRGSFNSKVSKSDFNSKKNLFPIDGALKRCTSGRVFFAIDFLLSDVLTESSLAVRSGTFGNQDIFTIAWLAELVDADFAFEPDTASNAEARSKKMNLLREKLKSLIEGKSKEWLSSKVALFTPLNGVSEKHSFPILRLVQAGRQLKAIPDYSEFFTFFEKLLHEQLSFSSIPDSRFDPAELMFCLEGMLLCGKNSVDRTIFDRVLEVLSLAQNNSAFWRPVKPYLTTPQGMALFPVSVEVANSLMRSCALADGEKIHDTYASKSIQLLRRYWQWLRARAVTKQSTKSEGTYTGWHSEHVNQNETIHLWETSQVADFLMSYRNMLQQHVARTTLVLSRVKEEFVKAEEWRNLEALYEPVTSLGSELAVYEGIGQDFISNRGANADENYSMLLYGPPGTGKTTIAKSVAAALDYRMITITVSDFLASGGAQVEARAKDIFIMLMAQPACVVLFDEIDHFLLDRDSERYSKQDTVFQFMTPGMLTKLADLRQSESVIFIVATNYEDRIDPAIKRTGRIDRRYLVLPPDAIKRLKIIEGLLSKYNLCDSAHFKDLDETIKQKLSDASLFLGFSDIKAVVQTFSKKNSQDFSALANILEDRARTISLEAYQSRFISSVGKPSLRETPMNEFLSLMALRAELKSIPEVSGKNALNNALKVIESSIGADLVSAEQIARCDSVGIKPDFHKKIADLFIESREK